CGGVLLMDKVTTVILTKDEELNIKEVVSNAMQISSLVLVLDSGSTDKTVSLAEASGASVLHRAWDNDFAAQRNYVLDKLSTEWVLYLDADERLNKELIEAIKYVVANNKNEQYSIKRKSVAFGQEFNHGVLKPDFVPRLFKVSHVKWVNKVHEKPICADKMVVLDGYIKHYTYTGWEQWLKKFDQYTSIWAEDAYARGKRVGLVSAFGHALFGFIQMAILKKGILDGGLGIVMSCNHFFYTLMKYLKLSELQRKGGINK
ncbi:MAG: glycosyltransferase family 2 protein, partial [Phascolarctobacterium sp.]